jgi:hypothetical protein
LGDGRGARETGCGDTSPPSTISRCGRPTSALSRLAKQLIDTPRASAKSPIRGSRVGRYTLRRKTRSRSFVVMPNSPDEETDEPLLADHRNYYKVEKWTKDGARVERMLYAGNGLLLADRCLRRRSSTGLLSG